MVKKKPSGDDVALYLFHQGNNMKAYTDLIEERLRLA